VIHVIDAASPLYGASAATLAAWDADLIVSVAGTDEVTLQAVHARHTYDHREVAWGKRHADLLFSEPTRFVVDLNRFDDIVPDVLQPDRAQRVSASDANVTPDVRGHS
jgi:inward rectifier potassium channel